MPRPPAPFLGLGKDADEYFAVDAPFGMYEKDGENRRDLGQTNVLGLPSRTPQMSNTALAATSMLGLMGGSVAAPGFPPDVGTQDARGMMDYEAAERSAKAVHSDNAAGRTLAQDQYDVARVRAEEFYRNPGSIPGAIRDYSQNASEVMNRSMPNWIKRAAGTATTIGGQAASALKRNRHSKRGGYHGN